MSKTGLRLPRENIINAQKAFLMLDKDGNGSLDKNEFTQFCQMIGEQRNADFVMNLIDTDNNGFISLKEWIQYADSTYNFWDDPNDKFLHRNFEIFDTDKDGKLQYNQLVEFFKASTGKSEVDEENIKQEFDEMDANHDGYIEFNEFKKYIISRLGPN